MPRLPGVMIFSDGDQVDRVVCFTAHPGGSSMKKYVVSAHCTQEQVDALTKVAKELGMEIEFCFSRRDAYLSHAEFLVVRIAKEANR